MWSQTHLPKLSQKNGKESLDMDCNSSSLRHLRRETLLAGDQSRFMVHELPVSSNLSVHLPPDAMTIFKSPFSRTRCIPKVFY